MKNKLDEFEERLELLERRVALADGSDELLTVRQASKLTKVSERWLYEQARKDRRFPAVKIGSLVRIQKGEFIRKLVQDGR
jgi:excisionase family DNA binding protein